MVMIMNIIHVFYFCYDIRIRSSFIIIFVASVSVVLSVAVVLGITSTVHCLIDIFAIFSLESGSQRVKLLREREAAVAAV